MSFIAKFDGECAECGGTIGKGDEAKFVAFDEIVHVRCPADNLTLQRSVCPHCFCEVPATGLCSCRE